jgi:hypothetical protein
MEAQKESRDVGGWSTPRPGRFTPNKFRYSLHRKLGRLPWPIWTGAENLASTRTRFPDCPPVASRYTDRANPAAVAEALTHRTPAYADNLESVLQRISKYSIS